MTHETTPNAQVTAVCDGSPELSEPESAQKESGIPGNDTSESEDEPLCLTHRKSWATKVHKVCPKSKKLYQLKMRNNLLSSINQKLQTFNSTKYSNSL